MEVRATIDEKGQFILDRPLTAKTPGPVRILVLFQEPTGEAEEDPEDTLSVKRSYPEGNRANISLNEIRNIIADFDENE
ncbi:MULTISPECIES: hypothetical protein [unclassified Microcoleus]|uniref:hypothetical protein n=1 Tax=unclassified Microcoleus TaxID=2642155 RepID=UPI002FD3522A